MAALINFTILIFVITEYFSFFYVIVRRDLRVFWRKHLIWVGIIFSGLIVLSFMEWRFITFYFIGILFTIAIIYLIFEISILNILKHCVVAYPALSILESIVVYVLQIIINIGKKENAIICMGCIAAGIWGYFLLLGRKLDKDIFQMSNRIWLIVSGVMFLVLGLISYFTYILTESIGAHEKTIGLMLITLGGLAIFILIYVMIYYFNTKQKYQAERDFLERYNEQQKQYFEDLLRREQETRQFRHDITSHLLQIQNFCVTGKHKDENQYISELLNEITLINKKGYSVGNDIIDTILNTFLSPVALIYTIKVKGYIKHEVEISRKDLCVIVSNLIKNAVEAVGQCTCNQKELIFEVNQGKKFLSIKMKNSMDTEKITIQNNLPVTGKENKRMHGFGIRNVKTVAESYHGSYQYRIENGYYIAEVQLQISPFNDYSDRL